MTFKKIDHINIVVKDLKRSKKFFVQLGFTVQIETILEGDWLDKLTGLKNVKASHLSLSLNNGETNIELLKFINPQNLTTCDNDVLNKTGFRHIAFEVEDIEKVVSNLKNQGFTFFSEIQRYKNTNKKLCYLRGPEEIVLELAEYKK